MPVGGDVPDGARRRDRSGDGESVKPLRSEVAGQDQGAGPSALSRSLPREHVGSLRATGQGPVHGLLLQLQRDAGNRAVKRAIQGGGEQPRISRHPGRHDHPHKLEDQEDLRARPLEYTFKKKVGQRGSLSFKMQFAPAGRTTMGPIESAKGEPDDAVGGSVKGGFWEEKAARERVGGKAANKLSTALFKGSGALTSPIAGLEIEIQTKLFEMQVEGAKDEADINALTLAVRLKGDVTDWAAKVAGAPEDLWKVTVLGEAKVAPHPKDLKRIRDMWKQGQKASEAARKLEPAAKRAEQVQKTLTGVTDDIAEAESKLKTNRILQRGRPPGKAGSLVREEAFLKKYLERRMAEKAVLEAQKEVLTKTIRSETKALRKAKLAMAQARRGLKDKTGRAMGKALATQTGKAVSKILARVIPIINIALVAWDLYEVGRVLYQIWKYGWGEGGDGGDGGDGDGGDTGEQSEGASGAPEVGTTEGTGSAKTGTGGEGEGTGDGETAGTAADGSGTTTAEGTQTGGGTAATPAPEDAGGDGGETGRVPEETGGGGGEATRIPEDAGGGGSETTTETPEEDGGGRSDSAEANTESGQAGSGGTAPANGDGSKGGGAAGGPGPQEAGGPGGPVETSRPKRVRLRPLKRSEKVSAGSVTEVEIVLVKGLSPKSRAGRRRVTVIFEAEGTRYQARTLVRLKKVRSREKTDDGRTVTTIEFTGEVIRSMAVPGTSIVLPKGSTFSYTFRRW